MNTETAPLRWEDLPQRLHDFAAERAWQPFHAPKNLASALIVEAGELLEHFQWLTEDQSRALAQPGPAKDAVAAEMACHCHSPASCTRS
jgi:NTP pyrophosphatase (non-canonical NTP hydrolase)